MKKVNSGWLIVVSKQLSVISKHVTSATPTAYRLPLTAYRSPLTAYRFHIITIILLSLFLSACSVDWDNPPRLATATAQATTATAQASTAVTPQPLILPAPTATPGGNLAVTGETPADLNWPTVEVWVNETSPAHEAALDDMVAAFSSANAINVEIRQVAPSLLPTLMETAVLSDTLPDLVLHPLDYTIDWASRGVFDAAAATAVIESLGQDTFDAQALELVQTDGQLTAVPSDGYQQLFLYRSDWFAAENLAPPDNYGAMLTAAETISDTANLVRSFVIPTESNLVTTHQAFEHLATANDCRLVDDEGNVRLLDDACAEAINFYFSIVNRYSPPGVQTDTSTLNAYLEGRTGMIMGPPTLLPMFAGLDEANLPSCPDCTAPGYLAANTGVLTRLWGNNPEAVGAAYGELRVWGITNVANRDAAAAFLTYWFTEGYTAWLAVDPIAKVPMRLGTAENPGQFIDAWGTTPLGPGLPSLQEAYGDAVVTQLRDGVAATNRWGFRTGRGDVIGQLYRELTFSVVLQEMLSGYFPPDRTLAEADARVNELLSSTTTDDDS